MTSVLTPVLFPQPPHGQPGGGEDPETAAVQKEDTKEYLADMLRELSAIAQWAQLSRAQSYIDAALREIESQEADA
jgi:NTP pyrophosphatase (non-canonical NTP hydrolase)